VAAAPRASFLCGAEDYAMKLKEQIEEMEAKMTKARDRVDWGDDCATYEDMADGYQMAYDWAEDVAERAIKLLKEFDKASDA
jgi:hypothetical protein